MTTRITSACVAALALSQLASANPFTVSGSVGGAPTGVSYVNFDNLSAGQTGNRIATGPGGSVAVTLFPDAQVVTGSASGVYAAPYISGLNGQGFASQTAAGPDTTPYLTSGKTGASGKIEFNFGTSQQYFGLLWGSVDTYNTLSFYDASHNLIGSVTGSDVTASPNGNQSVGGTLYVNINSSVPFQYVDATSTSYAFELDNVAYNTTQVQVPDSSVAGALGFSLLGLVALKRRLS